MNFNAENTLVEMKSLRSFFEITDQDNLDFLGEGIHIIFWSYDIGMKQLTITQGMEKLFGYYSGELSAIDSLKIFLDQENKEIEENLKYYFSKKAPFDIEYKVLKKDKSVVWLKTKGHPVFNHDNEIIRFNGVTRDITMKIKKEEELAESAAQYQTLVEKSAQAVYISQEGKYQYVNKQLMEMTGYSEKELLSMSYDQLLDEESINLILKRVDAFLNGKDNGSQEINIIKKDNSKLIVELRSSIITYKNKPALMGTLLDITEKKKALEMVNHLAYYDTLTGLPNRNLFYKESNKRLKEAQEKGMLFALLFLDLDQFKTVNDTFGHHAGDLLISETADRLKELVPANGFIARYGGDEFVALIPYDFITEIEDCVKDIIKEAPQALSSEIKIKPSIGISLFPEHGNDMESLLRYADIAMYQSKRNEDRLQNYSFYNHSISEELLKINKLTSDLPKGLELGQFYLAYQPKVWLDSAQLEGVEALIRWKHPEHGNISPLDFIPLAEKSGHIIQIGDWVLEQAIHDMQKVDFPLILNVNISMRQVLQPSFVGKVESLLEKTGFPAKRLNLEITESFALVDMDGTIEKLKRFKKLGVSISLDDFGTGYSSLSYLTKLPIDCLKIDRSFVNQLETDESKKTIIKSIIEVANNLKMEVLAEGIETEGQAELLRGFTCLKGQGYYFSKPLLYQDLLKYIDAQVQKDA